MNKNKAVIALLSAILSINTFALTQPKFTIIPTTPTAIELPVNGTATIIYKVTNQTKVSRTLMMRRIIGIIQNTTAPGACGQPFTLASKQSCLLTLEVDPDTIRRKIIKQVEVCKTQDDDNNSPDPFLCSQTSFNDQLNIDFMFEPLSIDPENLILNINGPAGQIVVTSHLLSRSAINVMADFSRAPELAANVTQDASNCTNLAPGASCTLYFTPNSQAVSQTFFPIRGENTRAVAASIQVLGPVNIAVISTQPLMLQAPGGTGDLVIQNDPDSSANADNVTVDITGTPLATAGVTPLTFTCPSIAPGDTCTITYTAGPGPESVPPVTVNVTSDNASATTASIGMNGTPSLTLSPTSLALQVNGNTQTATVTNIGGATANNVTTIPPGVLSGVTITPSTPTTCPPIAPGGTCTISFSPGSSAVVQPTAVPIFGTGTNTVTELVSVGSFIYVTNIGNNKVSQCPINPNGGTGSIGTCVDSGAPSSAFSNSQGIVINGARTFAYMTNINTNSVTKCPINNLGGTLAGNAGQCVDSGVGAVFNQPLGIALTSDGLFAFVTNRGSSTVSSCSVDPASGAFSACGPTGSAFSGSNAIAINNTVSPVLAYIANKTTGTITTCTVSAGTLIGCVASASYVTNPVAIALNSAGNAVFITGNNSVKGCSVTSGVISAPSTCTTATSGFSNPGGIAINKSGNTAYVTNSVAPSAGGILACPLSGLTVVTPCNNTNGSQVSTPVGIAILQN